MLRGGFAIGKRCHLSNGSLLLVLHALFFPLSLPSAPAPSCVVACYSSHALIVSRLPVPPRIFMRVFPAEIHTFLVLRSTFFVASFSLQLIALFSFPPFDCSQSRVDQPDISR